VLDLIRHTAGSLRMSCLCEELVNHG